MPVDTRKDNAKKASAKDVAYEITLGDDPRVVSSKGKGGDMVVGTIRSDKSGALWTLYEGSESSNELMHLNVLSPARSGVAASVLVGLPGIDEDASPGAVFRAEGKHAIGERVEEAAPRCMHVLTTREPQWDPMSKKTWLDFGGRAPQPSDKNMQLTTRGGDQSDVALLVGAVDKERFNVDFHYPLSALQAFAFALIVADSTATASGSKREASPQSSPSRRSSSRKSLKG